MLVGIGFIDIKILLPLLHSIDSKFISSLIVASLISDQYSILKFLTGNQKGNNSRPKGESIIKACCVQWMATKKNRTAIVIKIKLNKIGTNRDPFWLFSKPLK